MVLCVVSLIENKSIIRSTSMYIQSESVAQGNCMNWNLRLGYTVQLYITCIYGQKIFIFTGMK